MVLTASPWAVWPWRLQSYRTFWLAHPGGSLHPGSQPVDAHRLAGLGQLLQPLAQVMALKPVTLNPKTQ
jgi:hypothetical protein